MNDDRISYAQLSQLIDGRDRPAAHAVENAVRGVNTAERTIRQAAARIRSALDETVQRLDQGLRLNDAGELQRMPADFDRAVILRQHHWQVLGALLTDAELETLTPPPSPPPDRPAPRRTPSPHNRRTNLMNHPAIVIRDIHRYGDDLTMPEAIGRLRGGGQVAVTVTDPAPPGGDPRGDPRFGSGITVRPALGGQTDLPPEISWEPRNFETADRAALFAEALARATPAAGYNLRVRLEAGDPMVCDLYATPDLSGHHGIHYDTLDLAGDLGLSPADDGALDAAEDAYFTAAGEAFWAEAEHIARDRGAQRPGARDHLG